MTGTPPSIISRRARVLRAQGFDHGGRRPYKNQPGIGAGLGKDVVFCQEPVPWVDGFGPGPLGGVNDAVDGEVAFRGRGRAQQHSLVRVHDIAGRSGRLRKRRPRSRCPFPGRS